MSDDPDDPGKFWTAYRNLILIQGAVAAILLILWWVR